MHTSNLLLVSLLAGLFSITASAAESTTITTKAAHHKAHHAKKDCVETAGKPCHLHKQASASSVPATTGSAPSVETAKVVTPVAATASVVAPVAASVASKTEAKADAVLSEAEGRALAQKSGCFTCHAIEKKVVGPAWKDVAAKYRGDASMEAKLVTKVSKGGSGVWGSTAMPANAPRVKDGDIQALVKFVLSLK